MDISLENGIYIAGLEKTTSVYITPSGKLEGHKSDQNGVYLCLF